MGIKGPSLNVAQEEISCKYYHDGTAGAFEDKAGESVPQCWYACARTSYLVLRPLIRPSPMVQMERPVEHRQGGPAGRPGLSRQQ